MIKYVVGDRCYKYLWKQKGIRVKGYLVVKDNSSGKKYFEQMPQCHEWAMKLWKERQRNCLPFSLLLFCFVLWQGRVKDCIDFIRKSVCVAILEKIVSVTECHTF